MTESESESIQSLAKTIDHTVLAPNCTKETILQLCEEAKQHQFAAVCIPPYFVRTAVQALKHSRVKVATVIGFPLGYSTTFAKVEEIKRAMMEEADELDVVVNICAIKNQDWSYVANDISSMTSAAHIRGKIIKVILETGLLTDLEIKKLCEICTEVGVNFVKTSTGFSSSGATVEVIELLRNNLPKTIKIKASGGIRSRATAEALLAAGADRLGCSSSIKIVNE